MNKQNILYETERTYVRPFVRTDFAEFVKLHQNPNIMKHFFSGVKSLLEAKKKFDFILDHYEKYGFSYFPVFKKEDDEYIGQTGVVNNPDGSVNLCFLFKEKFWGQGYATETTKATLKYCFEILELEKIKAMSTVENVNSRKVLEKCGLKFVEQRQVSEKFNIAFYELTKEQYFADKGL